MLTTCDVSQASPRWGKADFGRGCSSAETMDSRAGTDPVHVARLQRLRQLSCMLFADEALQGVLLQGQTDTREQHLCRACVESLQNSTQPAFVATLRWLQQCMRFGGHFAELEPPPVVWDHAVMNTGLVGPCQGQQAELAAAPALAGPCPGIKRLVSALAAWRSGEFRVDKKHGRQPLAGGNLCPGSILGPAPA